VSNIKHLREILNKAGSEIDESINILDKMTLVPVGNEIFEKHLDGIRNTVNKIYIDLGILNVKTLRAAKFEPNYPDVEINPMNAMDSAYPDPVSAMDVINRKDGKIY